MTVGKPWDKDSLQLIINYIFKYALNKKLIIFFKLYSKQSN